LDILIIIGQSGVFPLISLHNTLTHYSAIPATFI